LACSATAALTFFVCVGALALDTGADRVFEEAVAVPLPRSAVFLASTLAAFTRAVFAVGFDRRLAIADFALGMENSFRLSGIWRRRIQLSPAIKR
jgi:hypothetical protein